MRYFHIGTTGKYCDRNTPNPPILPSPHFRWVVKHHSSLFSLSFHKQSQPHPAFVITMWRVLMPPLSRSCIICYHLLLTTNYFLPMSHLICLHGVNHRLVEPAIYLYLSVYSWMLICWCLSLIETHVSISADTWWATHALKNGAQWQRRCMTKKRQCSANLQPLYCGDTRESD